MAGRMHYNEAMDRNEGRLLYLVLMVVIIVVVDVLFLRHQFRARLIANVAIVLAFLIFYLIFLKHR